MGRPKDKLPLIDIREIARLRHEQFMEPTKILNKLQKEDPDRWHYLNRNKIAEMEKEARERGIITFSYPTAIEEIEKLQEDLRSMLGLERVIVVENKPKEPYSSLLARWGLAAARYFEGLVCGGGPGGGNLIVGISGGQTLNFFANAVTPHRREHVQIHTLALIGQGRPPSVISDQEVPAHVNPIVNATILWSKCGAIQGNLHYATVAPFDELNPRSLFSIKKSAKDNARIRAAIEAMRQIHVFFTGLGQISKSTGNAEFDSTLSISELLRGFKTPKDLRDDGVVGDIGYNLFGDEGGVPEGKSWDYFLTPGCLESPPLGVEFYRDQVEFPDILDTSECVVGRKKVVVMAGKHKVDAIKAALLGGLFNVWITDHESAVQVRDWKRSLSAKRKKAKAQHKAMSSV